MHRETFDVITAPDGRSDFSLSLACATPLEHYTRTVRHSDRAGHVNTADEEVCSTGLRVYEGARVMASFLMKYAYALLPPAPTAASVAPPYVVELGCGCGLVGFTASTLYEEQADRASVIFTDASVECLHLVHQSGVIQGVPIADADTYDEGARLPPRLTFPLAWSVEGAFALRNRLAFLSGGVPRPAGLVLGSDLMYYRVDISDLLCCCVELLRCDDAKASGFTVLSHFMRLPNGRVRLAHAARGMGLCIVQIPLTAFLLPGVISSYGWAGLEVVVVFPPEETQYQKPACGAAVCAPSAWDVHQFTQIIDTRIRICDGSSKEGSRCLAALNALRRDAGPYEDHTLDGISGESLREEEAIYKMLL